MKVYTYDGGWAGSITVISSSRDHAIEKIYHSKVFQTKNEEHLDVYTLEWLNKNIHYFEIVDGMIIYGRGD